MLRFYLGADAAPQTDAPELAPLLAWLPSDAAATVQTVYGSLPVRAWAWVALWLGSEEALQGLCMATTVSERRQPTPAQLASWRKWHAFHDRTHCRATLAIAQVLESEVAQLYELSQQPEVRRRVGAVN